jgi:hypothetical protein
VGEMGANEPRASSDKNGEGGGCHGGMVYKTGVFRNCFIVPVVAK